MLCLVSIWTSVAYGQEKPNNNVMKTSKTDIVCKLTTPELQERKKNEIAQLKTLVLGRVETENGVRFKFEGTDKIIDLLTSFIKTERLCCNFFTFQLTVEDENNFVWLELSGPEGTKAFIETEIGF